VVLLPINKNSRIGVDASAAADFLSSVFLLCGNWFFLKLLLVTTVVGSINLALGAGVAGMMSGGTDRTGISITHCMNSEDKLNEQSHYCRPGGGLDQGW
jgi:hypothetical protein